MILTLVVVAIAYIAFNVLDPIFYAKAIARKGGPLWNNWPGSGFYEYFKGGSK